MSQASTDSKYMLNEKLHCITNIWSLTKHCFIFNKWHGDLASYFVCCKCGNTTHVYITSYCIFYQEKLENSPALVYMDTGESTFKNARPAARTQLFNSSKLPLALATGYAVPFFTKILHADWMTTNVAHPVE